MRGDGFFAETAGAVAVPAWAAPMASAKQTVVRETEGKTLYYSQDRVTALGTGIDGAVRRIALEYTDRGLLGKVTSHNNATVGSGVIVNQVAFSYNAFNRLIEDAQSQSGAVTGSTPKVGYSYANGAGNTTRRLTDAAVAAKQCFGRTVDMRWISVFFRGTDLCVLAEAGSRQQGCLTRKRQRAARSPRSSRGL